MSLVYLTYHNENVKDYDRVGYVPEPIQPLKYVSKHKKAVKQQINQPYIKIGEDGRLLISEHGKHMRRTMGCAKTPLNPPSCFLKKHQGLKWKRLHDHKCLVPQKSPPIPRLADLPPKNVCGRQQRAPTRVEATMVAPPHPAEGPQIPTPMPAAAAGAPPAVVDAYAAPCDPCAYARQQRAAGGGDCCDVNECMQALPPPQKKPCKKINYIKQNIKRIKNAEPRRPPPRYADTPTGETHNLIHSGLLPEYMCYRNFGKVPCYLKHHKKFIKAYKKACKQDMQNQTICPDVVRMSGVRKMTLDERVELLNGLKANYAEQLTVFQRLSLYTDTPTKKLRKARLEKDLDQLEWDIKFIQDNKDIYVHTSDD